VVVIGATPLGRGVAEGLERGGDAVVVLLSPDAGTGGGRSVACDFSSEAAIAEAIAEAGRQLGAIDQLVHAWVPPSLLDEVPFMDIDEPGWEQGCERALEVAWWVARQAIPPLLDSKGSLVYLVPTIGMAGGARHAMLAAYAEGTRVLAKSCARQLGTAGVTANTIATAPHLWVTPSAAADLTRSVSLSAEAFGRPGEAADDIAPLVAMLAAADSRFLTANTLVADGGVWMGL